METLRTGISLIIASLILGGAFVVGKNVESDMKTDIDPTITVQGEGKISAEPDIAVLTFGVQTGRQKTAADAMTDLSKNMNAIIAAMRELGIEDKDVSTQSLRLNPAYDYREGTRVDQGFEAFQNLSVKVRDLNTISQVLDAAVRQGANQVGGVSFTIDDPETLRAQARQEAIADAKSKAKILAKDLGLKLGEFKGYGEGGVMYPQPVMMRMESVGYGGAMDSAMAPDIPSGEQDIRVNVSLTYEVE